MIPTTPHEGKTYTISIPLIKDIIERKVLIVIGAGVSTAAGVVSSTEIAEKLRTELANDLKKEGREDALQELESHKNSLKEISQRYQLYYKNNKAKEKVRKLILDSMKQVDHTVFKQIAKLPICDIVTTNYDRLIENNQDKSNYSVIFEKPNKEEKRSTVIGKTNALCTNIIKMHGDIEELESMILTKSDYDDYDRCHENISKLIKNKFKENTILIIGYSMEDDNFRRIFSNYRNNINKNCYYVGMNKSIFKEEEWPQVEFIYQDAKDFFRLFVEEVDRYQTENPVETMEISKKAETKSDTNPFKFYKTDSVPLSDYTTIGKYFVEPLDFATIAEKGTHTIIEGDRGSGKSTILRYLSLETQLSLPKKESYIDDFVGFYVKLDPGLVETALREQEDDKRWITFFTHFLNILITERIFEILLLCKNNQLLEVLPDGEKLLCEFIEHKIIGRTSDGDSNLERVLDLIRDERDKMATIDRRHEVTHRTSTRYVYDFVDYLKKYSNIFKDKSIYFLLDEVDNLNDEQMEILILFLRTRDAPISYKVGIKTGHMKYVDPMGNKLQYQNDYEHLYCDRFIRERMGRLFNFFEKLANLRLSKSGHTIDIRTLLPESDKHKYAGFKNYCYLSSGLTRSFVTLVKDTLYKAYPDICEKKVDLKPIPSKKQEEVIRVKSRIHFNNYGGCEHPTEVRTLINVLGSLFREILYLSRKRVEKEPTKELRTVSQIEIKDFNELRPFLKKLLDEAVENNLLQIPLLARLQEAKTAPYYGYKIHRMLIPYFSLELPNRFPRTIIAEQMNIVVEIINGKKSDKDFISPIIAKLNLDEEDTYPPSLREFDYGDDNSEYGDGGE